MDDLLRILALLALIGGNAFFVIGEYSIVTARAGALRARGGKGAEAALRLMEDPVRVISTVQVGITAVGILTGAVGEPRGARPARRLAADLGGFIIAFAVVTYLSVVFGELVPKALTLDRAETLAALVAPAGRADGEGAAARRVGPAGLGRAAAAAVRDHRGDGGRVGAHAGGAARARRRGRGLGRDPARPGGAPAQRVRLRRPARCAT